MRSALLRGLALLLAPTLLLPLRADAVEGADPAAATAEAVATAPQRGECWAYGYRAAVAATGTVPPQTPVSCRGDHTALTVGVGQLDAYADGHLLALDAVPVQADAADRCRRSFAAAVGGSAPARSLSLLRPVWVLPSFDAYLDGAAWFRCDAVLLGGDSRLATLPGGVRGSLDGSAVPPRRLGRCSVGVPGATGSREVTCDRRHQWRAVAAPGLGADRYPGPRAAAATVRSACERVAQRSQGSVRYRFAIQAPSAADWRDGRRLGTCWLPDR